MGLVHAGIACLAKGGRRIGQCVKVEGGRRGAGERGRRGEGEGERQKRQGRTGIGGGVVDKDKLDDAMLLLLHDALLLLRLVLRAPAWCACLSRGFRVWG
jgi:hypothetical protein